MLAELFRVFLIASLLAIGTIWFFAARLVRRDSAFAGRAGSPSQIRMLLWPFGARHVAGVRPDVATRLNKMTVALFIASLVAIASMAVYSNLTFVLPALTQ